MPRKTAPVKEELNRTTTIRVDANTHARLVALSEESGRSIVDLVREAVTSLESRRFMDDLRAYYENLRENETDWHASIAEAEELARAAIRGSWDDESTPPR